MFEGETRSNKSGKSAKPLPGSDKSRGEEEEEEITAVSKLSGGRRKGRGKTRDVLISRQPFLTRPPSPHMVREKK